MGERKIVRSEKLYTREDVEKDPTSMYIFTDNTDRDSGKTEIPEDSWYSKEYGPGKHYPKVTSAVIRGLENAYPITTQRWYNKTNRGVNGRWWDSDFEEFKKVIDHDLSLILRDQDKYTQIVFPPGGIFNSRISCISQERVPKLYEYLMTKLKTLLL